MSRSLKISADYYAKLAADYQKKRDILPDALTEAGFTPYLPQGAYYMLAEVPAELGDDKQAAQTLLEESRVASVPGSAFYVSERGKKLLRFCFAKDFDALEEACRRVRAFRT